MRLLILGVLVIALVSGCALHRRGVVANPRWSKGHGPVDVKHYESMEKDTRKSVAANPDDAYLRIDHGIALFYLAKYADAEAEFRKADFLKPHDYYALINLSLTLSNEFKLKEAISVGEKAMQIMPDDGSGWEILASAYFFSGNNGEAAKDYERAIRLGTDSNSALAYLGWAYDRLGRQQDAEETEKRAIAQDPSDLVARTEYVQVLANQGKLEDSLTAADEALAINPNYAPILGAKGNTLYMMRRFEEAEKFQRTAITNDPSEPIGKLDLALTLAVLKRFDEADKLLDQVPDSNEHKSSVKFEVAEMRSRGGG